jgi:hypothetical protein
VVGAEVVRESRRKSVERVLDLARSALC